MRTGARLNVLDAKICAHRGLAVSARKQYAEYKRVAGILSHRACADASGTPVLSPRRAGIGPIRLQWRFRTVYGRLCGVAGVLYALAGFQTQTAGGK